MDTTASTVIPLSTADETIEFESFPAVFVFGMVITGFLGILLIPLMCIHSLYNFRKGSLLSKGQIALYITFFSVYLLTCIAYTFFRIDLILPMGTKIPCKFGYYYSTFSVMIAKIILFIIFLYRIDLAFHSSALGYPRKYLIIIASTYLIGIQLLYCGWIYVTYDIIKFEQAEYFGSIIGICTTGSNRSKYRGVYTAVLGIIFICDVFYNLLLCILFVYKLRLVIKMGDGEPQTNSLRLSNRSRKDNKLKMILKKQTILVLLACCTSMITLGLGAVLRGFSLVVPLDITFNAFCVWLMFSFSNKIWNIIVKYLCCCCYCCLNKDEFLIQMKSFTRALSLRDAFSLSRSSKSSITETNLANAISDHEIKVEKTNAKEITIDIDFKNAKDITLDDKNKIKNNTIINDVKQSDNSNINIPDTNDGNNENKENQQNDVIIQKKMDIQINDDTILQEPPTPTNASTLKSTGSNYSSVNEDSEKDSDSENPQILDKTASTHL